MDKPESICTCKQCKKNFPAPSKRFSVCSPECQALLDAAYVRPPRPTVTLTCQYCTKTVTRKAQRYEFGKYCSRPCAYSGRAITRAAAAAEEKARKQVERAQRKAAKANAIRAAREAQKATSRLRECAVCCGYYTPERIGNRILVCSEACRQDYAAARADAVRAKRKTNPSTRAAKALYKARRRMIESNARREKVDPVAVFNRDQWRCYICGVPTPAELKGTNEPRAPELEHVVSLTDGGAHALYNVACACRSCNSAKGARSYHGYRVNLNGPQQVLNA